MDTLRIYRRFSARVKCFKQTNINAIVTNMHMKNISNIRIINVIVMNTVLEKNLIQNEHSKNSCRI